MTLFFTIIVWVNFLMLIGIVIYLLVKNGKESFKTTLRGDPPPDPTAQFLMTDTSGNITTVPFSSIKSPLLYEADQAAGTRITAELANDKAIGTAINSAVSTGISNLVNSGQVKTNTDAIASLNGSAVMWNEDILISNGDDCRGFYRGGSKGDVALFGHIGNKGSTCQWDAPYPQSNRLWRLKKAYPIS